MKLIRAIAFAIASVLYIIGWGFMFGAQLIDEATEGRP